MKNILGLDLGTNSIGWAVVTIDDQEKITGIKKLGSRIIPMSQDVLANFDKGVTKSQTAERTAFRGVRRLRERSLLRRERLHRVLHTLGFLPEHYNNSIGWDPHNTKEFGKFKNNCEPKLAWKKTEEGKTEFIFMDSFNEMIEDFKREQPESVSNSKKIPLDWTLYYLRTKALHSPIKKEELAWILLNFNQKRGYYQLRGEDEEEDKTKNEEFFELKVDQIEETDEGRGNKKWYKLHLENGWIYPRQSDHSLDDLIGKTLQLIVTTEFEKDGITPKTNKEGEIKRSFRAPKEDDWALIKKRTERQIDDSKKTIGEFIYQNLLLNPSIKIKGGLVRVIERKYYKEELRLILEKQAEFHPEFKDKKLLEACIKELYTKNLPHQQSLLSKDLIYLLIDDLIFYQRPLKSKKSLIANCPYEHYLYTDKRSGEMNKMHYIKCIAKSNPYYQEFRLWQFIANLRLFSRESGTEVTNQYLSSHDDYAHLFLFLNNKKEIVEEQLLKDYFKIKKSLTAEGKVYPIRWNYVEDKKYPCNETRYELLKAFEKANIDQKLLDNNEIYYKLWHLLYSIDDKAELKHALENFNPIKQNDAFVEALSKIKPFKKEYGAYSEKAIKKLLEVMRRGYLSGLWDENKINPTTKERISNILSGNISEDLQKRMGSSIKNFTSISDFQGLPEWLACYVVYGRHSEVAKVSSWKRPEDIINFLNTFKQGSMRNPIVEQCVLETLRTVYDIWKEQGHIDEIHVELGREMKKTKEERERLSKAIQENETTNMRIKALLLGLQGEIEGIRPFSPMQQEILRIYEEGALTHLDKSDKNYDDIIKLSHQTNFSNNELIRYKLWLEQKYHSPYTGKPISLSKLFTPAYEIEHVIPQSRYFDNSLSNKVICESEVNKRKDKMLGMEFIKHCGGEIIKCASIGDVTILKEDEYKQFVTDHYAHNSSKKRKLLMEDIPQEFINRQLNDSRYISRYIKGLLSNIVRTEDEKEDTSKFLIPCTGAITDKLKKDWGLNDIWNTLVYPRFDRMNKLTNSEAFGHWENKDGKQVFQTSMPLELQQGFNKKRIDHRHHAMDALAIACASRNIINYLNNESAKNPKKREDLRQMLCEKNREIKKPWPTFTQDAQKALEDIVVSFKNYVRVINKTTNHYEHYNDEGKKVMVPQTKGDSWAIRKPLHKETVFGRIKTNDRDPQVAVRKSLDTSFTVKQIEKITDTGIQKILKNYLETRDNNPEIAFSPEGIKEMNLNIKQYNNGKEHQPIIKVRVKDALGNKFPIGETGNKNTKYVVAEGGTNLYFGIYEDKEGKRDFSTMPLNITIEYLKQGLLPLPTTLEDGSKLKFYLSPNDLVYVPNSEEQTEFPNELERSRIYKFVDASGTTANFVPHHSAQPIFNQPKEYAQKKFNGNKTQNEYGVGSPQSKNQKSLDGIMIKKVCWKLEVDRLGNIIRIIK